MSLRCPYGMEKSNKFVSLKGTNSGTGIFYKRGYGEEHCNTLPAWYPLPSLSLTS